MVHLKFIECMLLVKLRAKSPSRHVSDEYLFPLDLHYVDIRSSTQLQVSPRPYPARLLGGLGGRQSPGPASARGRLEDQAEGDDRGALRGRPSHFRRKLRPRVDREGKRRNDH